jgi:hypothetical protein
MYFVNLATSFNLLQGIYELKDQTLCSIRLNVGCAST